MRPLSQFGAHAQSRNQEPKDRLDYFNQNKKDLQAQMAHKIDASDMENPQLCAEYATDIYEALKQTENIPGTLPEAGYMKKQEDLNEKMRAVLIDWLVEVHLKFKLQDETLFLTVNLIDRYLSVAQIQREKLQLVGVASLLIASKYEEIYPPIVNDFVYITDNAYKREEILAMER